MRKSLIRSLLLLLGVGVVSLGLTVLSTVRPADPETSVKADAVKRGKPAWASLDFTPVLRTASAAAVTGELDRAADQVYGQPDFHSGSAPLTATDRSLSQPRDIAIYDSGQVFVADTENNRVLGWNCIYNYENGDYADFVLGQPNFETTTALDPPTAAGMNGPTGVAVGFDGFLYVSDTGNNRVLVFFPTNYDEYWDDEEVYYHPDKYYCEDGLWYPSDFYAPIYENGQTANYALGQPDFVSGSPLPTAGDTLSAPMGLVTDANDNLVIADHGNNRVLIFEWNEAGGIGPSASWVIGQGTNANAFFSSAAPDPPTQRSMSAPSGVAASLLGDAIYVADTGNNRILYFNSDPIDAVADGLIGQPDYTSNMPNNRGLGASSLFMPMGVEIDAGNRLYVADTGNQRVLIFDQVNPDGVADEVFGQPDFTSSTANNGGISASSLYTPTGIATDIFYADAYIVDTGNNRALQYNRPLVNPVPAIAELDPGTVRAGAGGFTLNIWGTGIISDTVVQVNGITRTIGSEFLGFTQVTVSAGEVITTGQLTVTLRNPAPGGGLSTPVPVSIFVPTLGDDLADSVLGQKGFTTSAGAFAPVQANTLYDPAGAVVDPATGRLFVSDLGNHRVLSWSSNRAQEDGAPADLVIGKPDFTTYFYQAPIGRNLIGPAGLALDSQGNLYVADADFGAVLVYTKPFTNGMDAALTIENFYNPLALALDSQDNLYVADTFNHRILVYMKPLASQDTTPDRVFGQADFTSIAPNRGGAISADSLYYPSGVVVDGEDNLIVSDSLNHRVLVYLNPTNDDATADIVFGQMGDFTTGASNKDGLSAESLNYPFGLLVDSRGSLWVADSDNNRVLRFDDPLTSDQVADKVMGQSGSFTRGQPNQGRSAVAGAAALSQSTLREPVAIALTATGDLFIVDEGNNRVLGFLGVQATNVPSKLFLPSLNR